MQVRKRDKKMREKNEKGGEFEIERGKKDREMKNES
jgi:hypothetical protein